DLIIPGPSYVEHADFATVTSYETIRKYTKWSGPVFEPEPGVPHDWEIFAGIAARLQGTTLEALEEAYVERLLTRALDEGRRGDRVVSYAEARAAIGDVPGPDRLFDIMIRGGPFGDAFGAIPDGLNLDRVKEHPHG